MKRIIIFVVAVLVLTHSQSNIFQIYYKQSRTIAEAMTIDQLAGQMTQADFATITDMNSQTTRPD